MWQGKNWWLTPIVVIVLLMSGLVVFMNRSEIAPLIYAVFYT
jgi:hypothetical protein